MERNRFFKSTWGVGGEYVIASTLDASGAPVAGVKPTAATVTVTVAGTPTLGDKITIVVGGANYAYLVKSTDTTAATLVASIVSYLNTNTQGFTASVTGTTSAVFSLAATNAGTLLNGVVVSSTLGAPNAGPTFSTNSATSFGTNGIDADDGAGQATFELFCTNGVAGSLGVFWDDNHEALLPASTNQYANISRKFFYAFKTQDTTPNVLCTTSKVCNLRQYRQIPYYAGQGDIWTMTFTGTYTAGQFLHVKIIDATSEQVPYPNFEYIVASTGTIATDLTAIAALINAEITDPIATASATGGVLTVTGTYNSRQIKVAFYLEPIGQPGSNIGTDQSACAFAQTQISTAEVGTTNDMLEFEKYFKIQNGIMIYTEAGMLPTEFSSIQQLTQTGVNYGFLTVTERKEEIQRSGAIPGRVNRTYTVIAVPTALLAQLAAY